ncbi:MAG TPA: M81 family metallopeptidase [Pirellulales bacterium]|nr:M81 family metallopeptidase [Pirellulales bacterium]
MRVGIVALLQESNTFLERPTSLERFRENLLVTGDAVRGALAEAHHEVGGFFQGLDVAGIEAVGIFAARALPYGCVTAEACESLTEILDAAWEQAGELDGLLVAPHGATVGEDAPDFDGYWLGRVRSKLGRQKPIIGTLDPHANLSPAMIAATDTLIAYRTNPHLDQRQRGLEAASLMVRTLRGAIRPVQRACFPPLAINIERQLTAAEPCLGLLETSRRLRERPGVLTSSILLGFPYSDVAEMGSAAIVATDGDESLAQELADELGMAMWNRRDELVGQLVDIPTALDKAQQLSGRVCLLDMGDNVGGGSPADGTLIAHELLARGMGPSFVCLYDPAAVEIARTAGVGATVQLSAGGHTDKEHGPPLALEARVWAFAEGRWKETEPRHGGIVDFDQGLTAIVRAGPLLVMLTTRRMAPLSLGQLTACGVDPTAFRYLIAKGVHSPVAAYEPVCSHFVRVDTPGVTTADMNKLTYQHRRRPMFPFEANVEWNPASAQRIVT